MPTAISTFTNDVYEEDSYDEGDAAKLARIHIERSFAGALEGSSTAELLTAATPSGGAVYLALDHVRGALDGRRGSFVLRHTGTVSSDGAVTEASVVPGSGVGELDGLLATGRIEVDADGTHRLLLDYELPAR
jgi:hypothetical protein